MQEVCLLFFKNKNFTKNIVEDYDGDLCKNSLNCIDSIEIITYKLTDNMRVTRHKNKG